MTDTLGHTQPCGLLHTISTWHGEMYQKLKEYEEEYTHTHTKIYVYICTHMHAHPKYIKEFIQLIN